ncbi:hypothetical protein NDU88_007316 [Pleurodeles waltl]|uniref:Uncharacterized protein n=1 Tax=Pleurodeles waltl TaxID=8319 RepID=A0AAV7VT90_PLEWA|nr:hypothetical protein NDU88_007316 [Pleurodeles waltl]
MGKTDKNQPKLHFDQRKPQKTVGERAAADTPEREDMPQVEEPEPRQILAAMQQSLAQIDSKIDCLTFRMDRMTERLNKHGDWLDQSSSQAKMNKALMALQTKVDDLEARSHRNNLRIVGVAESTDIDIMEGYIERLLDQLLGCVTFSERFAHLEKELAQLEQEHLLTADRHVLCRIHTKLVEFQDTALTEVQHMGTYATAHIYGEAERPGAVLANIAHPNREKDTIMAIQDEDGNVITDPERIANRF